MWVMQMAIRWSKSDIKKLRSYVSKFNGKITRTEKTNPGVSDYLPSRLNVQEITSSMLSRKDLNNLYKSIDRFMRKGSERLTTLKNGIIVTQYEKREREIQLATVNRQRIAKGKLERLPGIGRVKDWESSKLKKIEDVKQEEWERFTKRLEKEYSETERIIKDERYLANWTQSLFSVFGDALAMRILNETSDIDRSKLIEAVMDNIDLNLDFVYDLIDAEIKANRIIEELRLL